MISDFGFRISDLGLVTADIAPGGAQVCAPENQKSESQTEPGRRREAQIRNQKSDGI